MCFDELANGGLQELPYPESSPEEGGQGIALNETEACY